MLTGTISTYASGVDLAVEWKIKDFFTLSEEDNAWYESPDFSFGGERWYLRIYPNGWNGNDSFGHVNLDLSKFESNRSINQSFSISLKSVTGEKYNEQHGSKDFDDDNCFHEFNRFIQRSELRERTSELAPKGDLTVICTMKSSTSAGNNMKVEKYNEQHCTKDFDDDKWKYILRRFLPRSELTMRRSELVPDDDLTVVCTMKNMTSAGSARNKRAMATSTRLRKSNTASAECRHCKGTVKADSLSSHEKKCMHRPTMCPDCLEVVVLEKWLNEHDCQQERPEAGKEHKENSENAGVNASTQTEEDSEACASGSSISSHWKKLHDDLKELFLKKEDCDVIIKVKGSEIPAHRVILKARSPVFASTFQHNMKENATGIVEIEDSDPSPFMDFLNFLYCGDIGMISEENVFDLFRLADKYEVLDLKAMCLEFMKKNITVDTFCETITLALQYSETELIALTTDFFVRNAEEILQTIKWQTFAAENPTQSNELTIKLVKWFKHSNA